MPTKPAKIFSSATVGLDAQPIEVETDLSFGLHSFTIVGLPDKAVGEAKERVAASLKNSGFQSPKKTNYKITVNLAPADLKKEGSAFDLAIAIGFLLASEQLRQFDTKNKVFVGELTLDGQLRPVNGVLAAALMTKAKGLNEIFVPGENAREAALIKGIKVFGASNLNQVVRHLERTNELEPTETDFEEISGMDFSYPVDMAYIKGQGHVKRALEIAAAGGHNVAMKGPPGAGKTLLAKALASILPKMEMEEALDVSRIYSVAGYLSRENPLMIQRPFRNPHHTASEAALIGGGNPPRPGEISLAHRGVLFLDEFPEFHRDVIESLRQPLEDGRITVSRTHGSITYPAKFILVASQNPCPCGFKDDPQKECVCSTYQINKYQKKISGPIGDRIDIHLDVPPVEYEELISDGDAKPSSETRKEVEAGRQIQLARFKEEGIFTNSEMNIPQIKKHCQISPASQNLLKAAVKKHRLSARAYHRILKLARTIADLYGLEKIHPDHIGEAIQYRTKEEI